MVRGAAYAVRARHLEARRRPSPGTADEDLRLLRRNPRHPDGYQRRIVFEFADDLLWQADPSGGRDVIGTRGPDLCSRRAWLCLCRLAGSAALSRWRRAAMAVRARLRLADPPRAG